MPPRKKGYMTPKLSICVPTYNRADSLRNTINAMRNQATADWELIVGDDASTDHTREVVQEFANARIRYHRNAVNLGIYDNWNSLLSMARGDYVCIYHDHDCYLPTILERSCEILDHHPTVSFVHTASILIDRAGTPLDVMVQPFDEVTAGVEFQTKMLDLGGFVTAATAMVRRAAYQTAGRYRPEYGLVADKDMWLRLAEQGDVGYVACPQALILARSAEDATASFRWEDLCGARNICKTWISSLFPAGSKRRRRAEKTLARQWDRHLLRLAVKTAAFETPEVLRQHAALFRRHVGHPAGLMIGALGHIGLLRRAIRWPARLRHHRSLERRMAAAVAYCHRHREIAAYFTHEAPSVSQSIHGSIERKTLMSLAVQMPRVDDESSPSERHFNNPDLYLKNNFNVEIRSQLIRKLLGEPSNLQILDLGCGDGRLSLQFLADNNRITLVDRSRPMLERARENTPEHFRDRVGYVNHDILGFQPSELYDVVICVGVLAHVTSIESAVAKIASLVRPGGRCIIEFTDAAQPLGALLAFVGRLPQARFSSQAGHLAIEPSDLFQIGLPCLPAPPPSAHTSAAPGASSGHVEIA